MVGLLILYCGAIRSVIFVGSCFGGRYLVVGQVALRTKAAKVDLLLCQHIETNTRSAVVPGSIPGWGDGRFFSLLGESTIKTSSFLNIYIYIYIRRRKRCCGSAENT